MAGILRNFQPALKNVVLKIKKTCSTLTQTVHRTRNQDEKLGISRKTIDFADLTKLINWFECDSIITLTQSVLNWWPLDSGMIANEDVKCDNAKTIGMAIQKKLNNVSLHAASIKRSDQAVTLNSLEPTLSIGDDKVVIDPLILFYRLIVLMQRYDNVSSFFKYELSVILTSLFKDMMREPSKSSLTTALDARLLKFTNQCDGKLDCDGENESEEENDYDIDNAQSPLVESVSENDEIVLDGGYLLHQLFWKRESTFRDIVSKSVDYVDSHYGQCTVTFDGYCEIALTLS